MTNPHSNPFASNASDQAGPAPTIPLLSSFQLIIDQTKSKLFGLLRDQSSLQASIERLSTALASKQPPATLLPKSLDAQMPDGFSKEAGEIKTIFTNAALAAIDVI